MGESGLIGEHFAGEATPLRVAKVLRRPDDADFWEVLSVSTVKFDPRPGWVLLAKPIGARPRRQELVWMRRHTQVNSRWTFGEYIKNNEIAIFR